jgi:hypothetical protein
MAKNITAKNILPTMAIGAALMYFGEKHRIAKDLTLAWLSNLLKTSSA